MNVEFKCFLQFILFPHHWSMWNELLDNFFSMRSGFALRVTTSIILILERLLKFSYECFIFLLLFMNM